MSSEYMRQLMETVEYPEQRADEGIIDSIQDYFVDKGLEWKGKFSNQALGELDNRKLAQSVYNTFKYHVGKTGQEQDIDNLIKFFQSISPEPLHQNKIVNVLKNAGITVEPKKKRKKEKTSESFVFLQQLSEAQTIEDRELKKAIRGFVSYLLQQDLDTDAWLSKLIKMAPAKEQQNIKANLKQATKDVVQDIKQPDNKESDKEGTKEQQPGKSIENILKAYGNLDSGVIDILKMAKKKGYIRVNRDGTVDVDPEALQKEFTGGSLYKKYKEDKDYMDAVQEYIEKLVNKRNVKVFLTQLLKNHPTALD